MLLERRSCGHRVQEDEKKQQNTECLKDIWGTPHGEDDTKKEAVERKVQICQFHSCAKIHSIPQVLSVL